MTDRKQRVVDEEAAHRLAKHDAQMPGRDICLCPECDALRDLGDSRERVRELEEDQGILAGWLESLVGDNPPAYTYDGLRDVIRLGAESIIRQNHEP